MGLKKFLQTDSEIKWMSLTFNSAQLESKYRDIHKNQSLIIDRIAILTAIVMSFLYVYMDSLILVQGYQALHLVRLTIIIPALILSYFISFSNIFINYHRYIVAINLVINALAMDYGIYAYNHITVIYFTNGVLLVIMFAYFMLSIRFLDALLLTFSFISVTILVMIWLPLEQSNFVNALQSMVAAYGLLTVAAYNREKSSRIIFLKSEQVFKQDQKQKETELSRITWLENMTSFLRHELRNSVTGVKTSVELLRRKHSIDSGDKYLDRAARGTRTIDRLLESVSNATNIESTFIKEKREPVLFSKLLQDQMDSYSQIYPAQVFKANIDSSDIRVLGNEARFIQIIDNLINNAVDHSEPNTAITVSLTQQNNNCLLSIINIGKPLPEDKKGIFDLFTSFRESKDAESKRGFGLYIVRLITESYGGFVEAKHYKDKQGAEFVVSLPVL